MDSRETLVSPPSQLMKETLLAHSERLNGQPDQLSDKPDGTPVQTSN